MKFPRDLHVHLAGTDERKVAGKAQTAAVEANRHVGQRDRQRRRREEFRGIRQICSIDRDIRAWREALTGLVGCGIDHTVVGDGGVVTGVAVELDAETAGGGREGLGARTGAEVDIRAGASKDIGLAHRRS